MSTTNVQYGLTAQTVLFYSDMVRCGFNGHSQWHS
uniref:Truncated protein 0.4 n=1 Tax=Enterobacteria phage T7.1 TaxID=338882 RepID=Q3V7F0_BPT7|nr:truncated protein 0.4 [Enterobacteria phage T7.1]